MTPSNFNNDSNAHEFNVLESGVLNDWGNVDWGNGVRPISDKNKKLGLI